MSLRDWLGMPQRDHRQELFKAYGILENPFPPASQTKGHPHMKTPADDDIVNRLRGFLANKTTQVLVVEGTQGIGKTNLLEFYTEQIEDLSKDLPGFVIIRYSADPEPDFGRVVRRIIQEFGRDHIQELAIALAKRMESDPRLDATLKVVRVPDLRCAFQSLAEAVSDKAVLAEASSLCFEYLLGQRVLRRHTDCLHVSFRLETTESRTQALQDLVYLSSELDLLSAVFLFLDELEKVGGLQTLMTTTRYLSGTRALIDALPKDLFMVMGMTPDARQRYSEMLPALAARFQDPVRLFPLRTADDALVLYNFYLEKAREKTRVEIAQTALWGSGGETPPLLESVVRDIFEQLQTQGGVRSNRPVTQRAFLASLHNVVERLIANISQS